MVPSCWGALAQVPCGFWDGFTWLGDSALLLPASLLILMWLALARRTWPTAWVWVLTFGVGSFVIVVSKIAAYKVEDEVIHLTLSSGGVISLPIERIDRIVDDEVVTAEVIAEVRKMAEEGVFPRRSW